MASDSLQELLGIICSVFDAYSAVLILPNEETGKFRLDASFSLGDHVQSGAIIAPGQGLVGWIIRNQKSLLINNFDRKRSYLGYYDGQAEKKIKAFMGCPIQGGGALCLDSRRTYSFSDKDQKILQLFTRLAANIQANTFLVEQNEIEHRFYKSMQLIQSLRKRHPKWGEFLKNFLELITQASGFSYAFLAARDERGESFFLEGGVDPAFFGEKDATNLRFPIKSGLVGWVFGNQQPVYGDSDSRTGQSLFGKSVAPPVLQSVILLPLTINRITRGVLILGNQEPVPITPALKSFVEMAADHLTLFLENLYLKTRS